MIGFLWQNLPILLVEFPVKMFGSHSRHYLRVTNVNHLLLKNIDSLLHLIFWRMSSSETNALQKRGCSGTLGMEEQFSWNHFLCNLSPTDLVFFTVALCCGAFTTHLS